MRFEDIKLEDYLYLIPVIRRIHFPLERHTDELVQAGRIGIFTATRKWKPELGSFATIAGYYIRVEMRKLLRERRVLSHRSGRERCAQRPTLDSLDRPLPDAPEHTMHDVIGVEASQEDDYLHREVVTAVRAAISSLRPFHRAAIHLWMAETPVREMGLRLGIGKSRADQVLTLAKSELARKLDHARNA